MTHYGPKRDKNINTRRALIALDNQLKKTNLDPKVKSDLQELRTKLVEKLE